MIVWKTGKIVEQVVLRSSEIILRVKNYKRRKDGKKIHKRIWKRKVI